MAASPLIGITCYPPNDGDRFELPEPYVACVRRAGGEVVLMPPGTNGASVDVSAVLDRLDGILFAGGGDLDPQSYGGSTHETVYALHPERDRDERILVDLVLDRGVPTLAICRGTQVLNVALGGTLVTHLPDTVGTDTLHRIEPAVMRGMPVPTPHPVSVVGDALIADVMEATSVTPMSWHHQAVDRVGRGLHVVATAPDGTIEATEHESHPWLCAVQWHPELTAATDPTQQRLFDRFVDAARGARS